MNERDAIILSALLHDIGKFMQRAEISLSQQSKNMEGSICPVYKGRHSHKHVLWTNEFFEKEARNKRFPIDVTVSVSENVDDNCANFASYHHRPNTSFQRIIQQADFLSSGERLEKDAKEEITGKNSYKKIRLHSIFEKVNLGNNPGEPDKYRYELNHLVPNKDIFPKLKQDLNPPEGELLTQNYDTLWQGFEKEFEDLPMNDSNTFLNALLPLLEKYTWCIPSSTMDLPDISLFDHSKTTAAIAICLYEFHKQTKSMDKNSIENKDTKKFLLVGGDLSGIQKYIFNLSHSNVRGLSKLLRARSFYIEALGKISAHYLLHELELPLVCTLMDAGGRFILLAPNTKSTKDNLEKAYREISEWFRKTFAGELVLNIVWGTELSGADFQIEKFPEVLSLLNERIEAKKSRKLQELLIKDNQWKENNFVLEELYKYENGACKSCGSQPATVYKEDRWICELCNEQEKVGKWLTNLKMIAYSKQKPTAKKSLSFFDGKYYLSFWDKKDSINPKEHYLIEEVYLDEEDSENDYGTRFLANYIPVWKTKEEFEELCQVCPDKNDCEIKDEKLEDKDFPKAKTFQCIALKSIDKERKTGTAMLGILKADVDRLGFVFGMGLGKRMSISRYSTLSRELNVFFSGYLDNKLRQDDYQNVYTVYAGGDDLFLIGDWETMIKFSKEMYKDFRDFTCQKADITLSSGLVTIKPHFPIRRGADMVEEFLKTSKNKGRNRLTLFNTTIVWDKFDKLREFAVFLDRQLNNESSGVKSGFIYRLLQYHKMFLSCVDEGKIEGLRFHSQMAYDIERNIVKRNKEKNIINPDEVKKLAGLFSIKEIDKELMINLKIPIFWVLYKNRKAK